jgi:hypothetical protein
MSGEDKVNPVDIVNYKKTILEMFNTLTEFEKKASIDAGKDNPEYGAYANIYILAVDRCREILGFILEGTRNE